MDVDMIKASQRAAEENMDMMAAIMQIEKLRDEFSDDQDHTFNTTTTTTLPLPSHEIQFSNVSTFPPSFANPSPLPFMNVQEPNTPPLHQSNGGGRFKTSSSSFGLPNGSPSPYNNDPSSTLLEKMNSMAAMREMIFRIAAMQPIHIDPESIKPPKRRNVKISKDPQSVAARHRRERISERIRILQRLVPGGTKMDTASMLDEAIHYVKFLKKQVQTLEHAGAHRPTMAAGVGFPGAASLGNVSTVGYPSHMVKACHQQPPHQHLMIDNVNMHMFRS